MPGERAPEMGEWKRHDPAEFPAEKRPTVELLNRFGAALHGGDIPLAVWRSTGPDYAARQVVITIYPDDARFRAAVARVMPPGAYRIEVDDIRFVG